MHDSTVHALHKCAGARGSPMKHPRQRKLKAGGHHGGRCIERTGNSITVNIVWQKKKKKLLKRKIKKEHKQLYDSWGAGSELAGAAGVTLQEAHYGRVTLGPSDELFQGQFSISVGVHLAEDLLRPFLWS